MTDTKKKWSDEAVAKLTAAIANDRPVPAALVDSIAKDLEVSSRSVASKLRSLDIEVASMAKEKAATFTAEQGAALAKFVQDNPKAYTYSELATKFPGDFTPKQIQGKLLALELTALVKAAEKVEAARTYSEAAEATFVKMANEGAFIEDIAAAVGKELNSVRGKALSLMRSGEITAIPKQKESHAKEDNDPVTVLGDKLGTMTVAEIAAAVNKTDRGIRTLLTRRGLDCKDYSGAAKQAKAQGKAAA